ncbi:MAG: hypothetical protein R3338_14910 [Thermoanaerobaculia bacterium]|nr:hypothetical protein [Thermoanaerobaculia bacterium]
MTKCSLLRVYAERTSLYAPERVIEEAAARHLWQEHPDARQIARLEEEGLLRGEVVETERELPLNLGTGEAEAITLFLAEEADLLLSDDGRALRACRLLGIPFTTTPRVTVDLARRGVIGSGRARQALEKIAVVGRYSRDVIAAALVALQEIGNEETDDSPTA